MSEVFGALVRRQAVRLIGDRGSGREYFARSVSRELDLLSRRRIRRRATTWLSPQLLQAEALRGSGLRRVGKTPRGPRLQPAPVAVMPDLDRFCETTTAAGTAVWDEIAARCAARQQVALAWTTFDGYEHLCSIYPEFVQSTLQIQLHALSESAVCDFLRPRMAAFEALHGIRFEEDCLAAVVRHQSAWNPEAGLDVLGRSMALLKAVVGHANERISPGHVANEQYRVRVLRRAIGACADIGSAGEADRLVRELHTIEVYGAPVEARSSVRSIRPTDLQQLVDNGAPPR